MNEEYYDLMYSDDIRYHNIIASNPDETDETNQPTQSDSEPVETNTLDDIKTTMVPNDSFSFKSYLDSDEGAFLNIIKSNMFLENNKDSRTPGLEYVDTNVDILITTSSTWGIGISSAVYEAFECYMMLKINSLPQELGGPNIKLLYTDYVHSDEKAFATKTDLGPNNNYGNEILKAIFTKYDGSKRLLKEMEADLIFLNRPTRIEIKKHTLPYQQETTSSIVLIDGIGTAKNGYGETLEMEYVADNLHVAISDTIGFTKEFFCSHPSVNFFCIYLDNRLEPFMDELYVNTRTIYYNDVKRIAFRLFRRDLRYPPIQQLNNEYTTKNPNYKKYLLYLTPNTRALQKVNGSYPIELLDDIIDALRITDLNPIGRIMRNERIEAMALTKKSSFKNENFITEPTDVQKILDDGISVKFILVGLDKNSDFEDALLTHSLKRGINAISETYNFDILPIDDIHSKYDVYIYTPTNNNWDGSPRFIPECIYYAKKIYTTKLAKKIINIGLDTRMNDAEKHLSFLDEDDIYYFPKMQLTRNLLGYWPE